MEDGSFEQASHKFQEWFLNHEGARISSKIRIADLRSQNAGRGVLAVNDIEEDEELFVIPRNAVLNVETSELAKTAPKLLEGLDGWLSLILVMIYEYLQGDSSLWKAYFDILPETLQTLMYWTPEELQQLKGSTVVDKIGKDGADATFKEHLLPRVMAFPHEHSNDRSEHAILGMAHRMGSLILAYGFDVEKGNNEDSSSEGEDAGYVTDEEDEEDASVKGMVPLADLLNADAQRNNARLFYEQTNLVMRSTASIKAGEEIFNDYGPLPRSDLLRRYGYITDNYARYDVVEISHALTVQESRGAINLGEDELLKRNQFIQSLDLADDAYDLAFDSSLGTVFPEEMLTIVRIYMLSKQDFFALQARSKPPKPILDDSMRPILRRILERRLQDYQASIAEDESLLTSQQLPTRVSMAVQVRLGEMWILQAGLDQLNTPHTASAQHVPSKRSSITEAAHRTKHAKR